MIQIYVIAFIPLEIAETESHLITTNHLVIAIRTRR